MPAWHRAKWHTREQVQQAVDYYTIHYARDTPRVLATEIHRCRAMVVNMLIRDQHEKHRTELRRLAGWLSAQLGDLAFTSGGDAGAHIHLGTGARLGITAAGRSVGAQSMIAFFGGRPADALDLARQASEYADTALHRAQITAWCELSALAALGHHDEPGRFGFDHAELHQHLAEAFLLSERQPGHASQDLHDRLRMLPAHPPAQRTSPEPNG